MIRQAVFGLVLAASCVVVHVAAQAGQEAPPRPVLPPGDIPLSRLRPDATVPVGLERGATATPEALWTRNRAAGTITRIDAKTNVAAAPLAVGKEPCASLVVAFDSLWVPLCGDRTIARVDTTAGAVTASVPVAIAAADGRIATGVGSIWIVTDRKGSVARVDPDTNRTVAEVYVPRGAGAIEAGKDALWITSEEAGRLTRVSPHTNEVIAEIAVGPKPAAVAVGEGAVWVLNGNGTITRADPATNKATATITLGSDSANGEIAAGAGSVWVSVPGAPLIRIDPRTNRSVQRFTGSGGGAVLVANGSLWVAASTTATWRLDPKLVEAVRP